MKEGPIKITTSIMFYFLSEYEFLQFKVSVKRSLSQENSVVCQTCDLVAIFTLHMFKLNNYICHKCSFVEQCDSLEPGAFYGLWK